MRSIRSLANLTATAHLLVLAAWLAHRPEPGPLAGPPVSMAREVLAAIPGGPGLLPVDPPLELYGSLLEVETGDDPTIGLGLKFDRPVNYRVREREGGGGDLEVGLYPVDRSSLVSTLARTGLLTFETVGPLTQQVLVPANRIPPGARILPDGPEGRTRILEIRPAPRPAVEVRRVDPALRLRTTRRLRDDLEYRRYQFVSDRGDPSTVHVLRVDLAAGGLKLALGRGPDVLRSRHPVSGLARRGGALAALNASFFESGGRPLGLIVDRGRLVSTPIYSRTSFGVYQRHRFLYGNPDFSGRLQTSRGESPVRGVNEAHADGALYVLTPDHGPTTGTSHPGVEVAVAGGRVLRHGRQDLEIPARGFTVVCRAPGHDLLDRLRPGDRVRFVQGLTPPWNHCDLALGGGPRLVEDGRPTVRSREERFDRSFSNQKAPRSAVGTGAGGELLLVAVDGRRAPQNHGVKLSEMAVIMLALGAVQAMNLDGGGSTAMWVGGRIVNDPSDGEERKVSTALLVVAERTGGAGVIARGVGERPGRS